MKSASKLEHRCFHFVLTAARLCFRDVILSKRWLLKRLLTTTLGLLLLLSYIILSHYMLQTPKWKWIRKSLGKNGFCWPNCEGRRVSCRLFSLLPISSRTEWHRINSASWLPRQFQNAGLWSQSFKLNYFRIKQALQRLKLCWAEKLGPVSRKTR